MNCPGCPGCPGNALTCAFATEEPGHLRQVLVPAVPASHCEPNGDDDMTPITDLALTPTAPDREASHMSAEMSELKVTMVDADHAACWTVDDVAAYLRVSKKTIYKWRLTDEGPPAARVGKHLRYDPADVVAWRKSMMIAA